MHTYWYDAWGEIGNVGDRIAPVILKHLLKRDVTNCDNYHTDKLLTEGSVAEFIRPNDVVWGSGLIAPMKIAYYEGVKFFMVRGPQTRKWLHMAGYDVPEIYGSGAFLLPEIIPGHHNKEYDFGIIPHYVEKAEALRKYRGHFIDVMSKPEDFVNEICKCKRVLSSSLHGIIIAEAYGIPAVWFQLTNKIIGGEFKFRDYYEATGRIAKMNYHQPLPKIDINQIKNTWSALGAFLQTERPK